MKSLISVSGLRLWCAMGWVGLAVAGESAHARIASCTPVLKEQRSYFKFHPGHYVAIGNIAYKDKSGRLLAVPNDPLPATIEEIASLPSVIGVQKRYYWNDLNPSRGVYTFSRIVQDAQALAARNKKLSIMLMWKFSNDKGDNAIPSYLSALTAPQPASYEISGRGEFSNGYIAALDNDVVATELVNTLTALKSAVDEIPNVSSIVFAETALGANFVELPFAQRADARDRFYSNLITINQRAACAFLHTPVIQLTNYPPGKLDEITNGFKSHGVSFGSPDTWINDPKMPVYSYYPMMRAVVPIGLIVAGGNYEYVSYDGDVTNDPDLAMPDDADLRIKQLAIKAVSDLGANYVFWRKNWAGDENYLSFKKLAATLETANPAIPKANAVCPGFYRGICRFK